MLDEERAKRAEDLMREWQRGDPDWTRGVRARRGIEDLLLTWIGIAGVIAIAVLLLVAVLAVHAG